MHEDKLYEPANTHIKKVLQRIRHCRTNTNGYHIYRCSDAECNHIKYQYHSCRDRHCPGCGGLKKQEWIEARTQELLPIKYYHVVFTLPHELNSLTMGNRVSMFKLLFDASAQTLLSFANDAKYLGAKPGIISVLHTWGQQLSFHPHVHCIVSGGGVTANNVWKQSTRDSHDFLFPVKALSNVYKHKYLEGLKALINEGKVQTLACSDINQLIKDAYAKDWVVYAKAPFGGPHAVIEYLGRYTNKVAISNHRIKEVDANGRITFDYKDYADGYIQKQMTLDAPEFIRRFSQHILPARFTKIRTYGYLANRNRRTLINEVLANMKLPLHRGLVKVPLQLIMKERYGIDINECPCCKAKTLKLVHVEHGWKRIDDG